MTRCAPGHSAAWTERLGFAVSEKHRANRGVTFVRTGRVITTETSVAPFFRICCVLLILPIRKKIASKLLCSSKLKFLNAEGVLEDRAKKILNIYN